MANEFIVRKGLIVEGASGGTVVDIQGSQGQLFSVTDDLSGSIFAVSDISGVPIFDVNSSGVSYFDGNVGIGTTSPAKKLHVKESTTATYAAYIENTIAGGDYLAMIGDAGDNVFEFDSGGTGGEAVMKMYSDGVLKNQLVANGTSWINGNVAIGATSSTKKLTVNGSFKLGTNSYIEYGGVYPYTISTLNTAAVGNLIFTAGSGSSGYESGITLQGSNTAGDDAITFTAGSSTAMVIQVDGKVGIGTIAPQGQLSLNSQIANSGTPLTYSTVQQNVLNGYYTTGESPNLYMRYFDIACVGDGDGTNGGGNIRFLTNPVANDTAVERMRVTSVGNVGIGTTSPDRKIHVEGGYYLKGGAGNTSYVGDGLWGATATPNLLNSTGGNLGLRIGYQDNGSGLYSPAYGFEVKSTDGIPVAGRVQRAIVIKDVDTGLYPFYINNNGSAFFDGNVGIGTTSPNEKLQVVGNIQGGGVDQVSSEFNTNAIFRGQNDGAAYINLIAKDDANSGLVLGVSASGTIDSYVAGFLYNNATNTLNIHANNQNAIVIDSSQQVGINVSAPTARLHVVGSARVTGAFYDSSNDPGTAGQVLSSTATGTNWVAAGGGGTSYWTATGNDIYNNNSANVGIGISQAAAAKLEVTGTGTTTFPIVRLTNASSDLFNHTLEVLAPNLAVDETNALIIGQRVTAKNAGYLGYLFSSAASNDNVLTFGHIGATNLMALTGDGKLGIGNLGPSHALDVTGNARVTGAFHDSSNSAGSSGQVLSSTGIGTDWISPPSNTVYTPSVFEIKNSAITASQNRAAHMEQTLLIAGSTGVTIATGQNVALTASLAGVYEISYTIYLETTNTGNRQIIGAYVERQASGGSPLMLDGSFSSVYMRLGGSNQGGAGTITNTFYAVIGDDDVFKFRTCRVDVNTAPVGVSITTPVFPATSGNLVKHTISFRKINAAS